MKIIFVETQGYLGFTVECEECGHIFGTSPGYHSDRQCEQRLTWEIINRCDAANALLVL